MKNRRPLPVFTPSNADPKDLERIFVQRHKLLDKTVAWFKESVTTGNKRHLLFVGPRGIGKTHLVSMVHHRVMQDSKVKKRTRVAWLGEDDVYTGLVDVALAISKALEKEYPGEFNIKEEFWKEAKSLPPDEAAEAILHDIVKRLGNKTLLLIMENLDRVFHGLGDAGQKKWRAILQETGKFSTLATSQQLFKGISSRDAAFYGFFEIHHLEPLSLEDARQLMIKVAADKGNRELVDFLNTPTGRYRVRALHYLAGGNHRLYVILSEFLTLNSLDGLVTALEDLADELTPFFQERIRSLSPQQGRIAQHLCDAIGALSVKQIASETFIAERNVSKHLGELRQKAYVRSERRGKETFYELAEPLMRLSVEVKNHRRRPLRMIALFLRAWFPEETLRGAVGDRATNTRLVSYLRLALEIASTFFADIKEKLTEVFAQRISENEFTAAMAVAQEIKEADRPQGDLSEAFVHYQVGEFSKALQVLMSLIDDEDTPCRTRVAGILLRGEARLKQNEYENAVNDYTEVLSLKESLPLEKADAYLNRGFAFRKLGQREQAIKDFSAVLEIETAIPEQKASAYVNRGFTSSEIGHVQAAMEDSSRAVELKGAPAEEKARALNIRGVVHGRLGEPQKEIEDYNAVLAMQEVSDERKATAYFNRGITHRQLEEPERAIEDFSAVVALENAAADQVASAYLNRGVTYGDVGEIERAIEDYSAILEIKDAPGRATAGAYFNRGLSYEQLREFEMAIADYTTMLTIEGLSAEQKAWAYIHRGVSHWQSKQTEMAIQDFSSVIQMAEVGDHQRAKAFNGRGISFFLASESERAVEDLSAVLAMEEVPSEEKGWAYLNRGFIRYAEYGEFDKAIKDYSAVLTLNDISSDVRTVAMFNLASTVWISKSPMEAKSSFERAFAEGDRESSFYGAFWLDLMLSLLRSDQANWKDVLSWLIPLYSEHEKLEKLGTGLVRSVQELAAGSLSEVQMETWNRVWRQLGKGYEELEVPLSALSAATQTIIRKSDRPLFDLPKEIRDIVRPLLKEVSKPNT